MFLLLVIFTIGVTIVFSMLNNAFLKETQSKSAELSDVIEPLLEHYMLERSNELQSSLEELSKFKKSINSVMVIDTTGKVAFSSNKMDVGKVFNKKTDPSCLACHGNPVLPKNADSSVVVSPSGEDILRRVTVIYNKSKCYGCHSPQKQINGKLIIDRSLSQSERFINYVKIIVFGSAILAMLLLVPFLSIMINKYIDEIVNQKTEIGMLYSMVDTLSKTINIEELKYLVSMIFRDFFKADEVDIVLPKGYNGFRVFTRDAVKNEIVRRKVEVNTTLYNVISLWMDGQLPPTHVDDNNRNVYLNITLGTNRLALIVIRKFIGYFSFQKRDFLNALTTHIAIAFENARLYSIAITDELTGLYTQRYFRHVLEKEYSYLKKTSGGTFSLLILDLDDFKKVNDTYGHLTGDRVLEETALTLRETIRENDLAFRYGGEEFAVVLHKTTNGTAETLAERIRAAIADMDILHDSGSLKITVSIGIANYPQNASTIRQLIAKADKALYNAKRSGKNKVIVAA